MSAVLIACPACDGTGTVTDWQHDDPEVGTGGPVAYECELCGGHQQVTPERQAEYLRAGICLDCGDVAEVSICRPCLTWRGA